MKLENVLIIILLLLCVLLYRKERFSDFYHRSILASTHWIDEPQVQHTFQDLKLQYPSHKDYFKNGCYEKEPVNAEVCKYHKHRFDPNQL